MPSLNRVMLIGHLTRDPECRTTPRGTSVCAFSLAMNRKYKTEANETKEEVTFADCECWGKGGEAIAKYMAKGRLLYVEGRLKLESWEDKETHQKRSRMKVVVEQFQFLGDRGQDAAPKEEAPPKTEVSPIGNIVDDPIPF